jgi:acyl-coenzyme A thioesterase PaaI-like protein
MTHSQPTPPLPAVELAPAAQRRAALEAMGVPAGSRRLARHVGDLELTMGDGVASSTMTLGPRLQAAPGRLTAGALGVLADEATGYAVVDAVTHPNWTVSSDIEMNLLGTPLAVGETVTVNAQTLAANDVEAVSVGQAVTAEGRLVAQVLQRSRYTGDTQVEPEYPEMPGAATAHGVDELLGARWSAGGDARMTFTVGPTSQNSSGNQHGGVALMASMRTAELALEAKGSELLPTSIHISYPRPMPTGLEISYTAHIESLGRTFAVLRVVGEAAGRVRTIAQVSASLYR